MKEWFLNNKLIMCAAKDLGGNLNQPGDECSLDAKK